MRRLEGPDTSSAERRAELMKEKLVRSSEPHNKFTQQYVHLCSVRHHLVFQYVHLG